MEGLAEGTPIPVERYPGPIHVSHGEDDALWGVDRTRRLEARLRAAGRAPTVDDYAGQGHRLYGPAIDVARLRLKAFFHAHLGGIEP